MCSKSGWSECVQRVWRVCSKVRACRRVCSKVGSISFFYAKIGPNLAPKN